MTPPPVAAAVVASHNALKAARKLTRTVPLFFQTSTNTSLSSSSSQSQSQSQLSQRPRNRTTEIMGSVEVQQQIQHSYRQPQSAMETATTTMSSLQAPLPRQLSHCTTLRRPIPNSYWATPYLLACEYPWSPSTPRPKLDALIAAGVRTFIDLTESGELLGYSQLLPIRATSCGLSASETHTLAYYRFPIPDRCTPSSPAFLARILAVLCDCEKKGRVAAVHCRGGIGRTGTVVGCWLVQSGHCRDGEEALKIIAQQWATVEKHTRFPCSPETGAQAEFVRTFKRLSTSAPNDSVESGEA